MSAKEYSVLVYFEDGIRVVPFEISERLSKKDAQRVAGEQVEKQGVLRAVVVQDVIQVTPA